MNEQGTSTERSHFWTPVEVFISSDN